MKRAEKMRKDAITTLELLKGVRISQVDNAYTSLVEMAENVIELTTPPPARRPLSSLTEEEARELYRLAFGNDYELENVTHHQDGSVKLWVYDRSELVINTNGVMCAVNTCYGNDALDFNAVAVVRYLDGLGIQLG